MAMWRFFIWVASRNPNTEMGIAEVMISVAPGKGELKILFMMTSATVVLVAVTLGIAVFAGPIYDLCHRAAEGLLEPSGYIRAVMGS